MATIGGTRTILGPRAWDVAAGVDVSFYAVPENLKPIYGDRPISFHVFLRIRPPAPMGRMLEIAMSSPVVRQSECSS